MINTLKITKNLEAASIPKPQADAIAEAIASVVTSDLVTKADLRVTEAGLRAELKDLELRLSDKINAVRDRITWMVGGIGGVTWILQIFGANIRHLLGMS